jgi:hypothetical protein
MKREAGAGISYARRRVEHFLSRIKRFAAVFAKLAVTLPNRLQTRARDGA